VYKTRKDKTRQRKGVRRETFLAITKGKLTRILSVIFEPGFEVFAGGGSSLPMLSRLVPTMPAGFAVSARLFYPPTMPGFGFIRIAS
jgi:hypothetical protein